MKVIITGVTGMIGEGVLLECLKDDRVTEVLGVSRKSSGVQHPKFREYLVPDFLLLKENDPQLEGYDACFFCAGVSSIGMKEDDYFRNTYQTTLQFAKAIGPKEKCTFIYVSGSGTDSSEAGALKWARVKGKTENDLIALPFKAVFGYRIGAVIPAENQKFVLKYYQRLKWLMPLLKRAFPGTFSTMRQVASSMIYFTIHGNSHPIIHIKDIKRVAEL
jgi:hypothetical protein